MSTTTGVESQRDKTQDLYLVTLGEDLSMNVPEGAWYLHRINDSAWRNSCDLFVNQLS